MLPFQWLKDNQEAHSFIYLLIQQIFLDYLVRTATRNSMGISQR